MTRKEKREAAAEQLSKIKLEWDQDMTADYRRTQDIGKTFKNLEGHVSKAINNEPQRRSQYLQAMREMIATFRVGLEKAKET